jgi:molybdopterin-guanine dinucleotide biosynthesis protein A
MGGRDKGLQALCNTPLAEHVAQRLAPQVSAMLISANRHLDTYEALAAPFGAQVVTDATPHFDGPLAGILAGLRAAHTELVLVAPCDTPQLPTDLAARLLAALDAAQADIAMAVTLDNAGLRSPHPVVALIRRTLADDLAAFLAAGQHTVRTWYARHTHIEVPFADERAFYNANSLQELADLERR